MNGSSSVMVLSLRPPRMRPYHAPKPGGAPLAEGDIVGERILGFALGIALVMSACGARSGPRVSPIPPTTIAPIPSHALPGAAAAPGVIDITTLSADAVDVAGR